MFGGLFLVQKISAAWKRTEQVVKSFAAQRTSLDQIWNWRCPDTYQLLAKTFRLNFSQSTTFADARKCLLIKFAFQTFNLLKYIAPPSAPSARPKSYEWLSFYFQLLSDIAIPYQECCSRSKNSLLPSIRQWRYLTTTSYLLQHHRLMQVAVR